MDSDFVRTLMAKLFLHIGPHKTGSAYIQKYCFENRDQLLSLGVNYPNPGHMEKVFLYGHHEAVEKVKTLEQNELDEYFAQYSGSAITLVSSETFDQLSLEEIKKLGKSLSRLDVRIIYYRRNCLDLLPSWWQEGVKHGEIFSFYDFVLPHILRPFASNIVNPQIVLDLYATVFGKDNITIIDYDLALQNGNILRPIFELLGTEVGILKNEIVNASLNAEMVEIIRALNIIASLGDSEWHGHKARAGALFLRKREEEVIRSQVEHVAAMIRDALKPLKLSRAFARRVNTAFKKNYASSFYMNVLDKSPDRRLLIPSGNWMLNKDALTACERIYQHIMTGDTSY
jgi:hypothetical protein